MSSPAASNSASQSPRIRVAPNRRSRTYGDLAASFSASYGLDPDPWQRLVLDDWLRERDGRWASLTCGLSVPRQNGKNGALEVRELFGMVGRGEKILHTAHQVKTAQKHFRRLKQFFGKKVADPSAQFPELNALVTEIRNVNGQEAIFLSNGGSVEVVARSTGSGRGFTVDVIVCDEAQDMSDEDQEALLSTSSSAPLGNPQWIYTGTPPGPKVNGEVFTRVRSAALADNPGRRCWHEWSDDGGDLDDRKMWARVNPGLITGRLLWEVVEGERGEMSDEGFGRERCGRWDLGSHKNVIPPEDWKNIGDPDAGFSGPISIGVDMAPDRTSAAVALAGETVDGRWLVALREHKTGPTGWVVPFVTALKARNRVRAVVIDKASAAASLIDGFERERVKVTTTAAADMADACGKLFDGVYAGWLVHTAQPQLAYALSQARQRDLLGGGAWGWNKKTSESDITPVVAVTLALWGARHSNVKKNPNPNPDRSPGRGAGRRVVVGRDAGRR